MNLIIDQGNTNIKFYFFERNKINKKFIFPLNFSDKSKIFDSNVDKIIYSSVSGKHKIINEFEENNKIHYFSINSKLPFINKYKSHTIGLDRLAAVSGALSLFPNKNILIIDIGTAITYDFLNEKTEFLGGNISPGINLRFKALNDYTKNLPLLEKTDINQFFADNTNNAIILGVQNGIIFEIENYINRFCKDFDNNLTIITGGDSNFFANKIKSSIFAEPDLVAIGLNNILNINEL